MKVERETAGIALPFTAGVLLAAYSGYCVRFHTTVIASSGAFFTLALALILLMSPIRRSFEVHWQWMIIGLAALSTGIICGITDYHTSVSSISYGLTLQAEEWCRKIQDTIDRIPFTDSRHNTIAKALLTGERSGIPKDIVQAFRKSGASHILALSGLHLGIIYTIITRSLSVFGNYRRIWTQRSVTVILLCGFYTIATGAGPSIVRAFIFIYLTEYGKLTHRYRSTGQLLLTALILQLTLSPMSIRSVGFQLSYAAMAGIAFILPRIKSLWPGSIYDDRLLTRIVRRIWNVCSLSISCQITTAPIAWYCFRTFPRHFLLTNLLVLPLTGLIIPAVVITLLLSIFGICPQLMILSTGWLISALIWVLEEISML